MYVLANLGIGLAFLNFTLAAVVVFLARRRDWPPAWALLLVALAFGSCGLNRLHRAVVFSQGHLPEYPPIGISDMGVAVLSFPASFVAWFAVRVILRGKTPAQIKELERRAAMEEVARTVALESTRRAALNAQRVDALQAMLSDYAHVDPAMKARMLRIVEGME